MALAGTIKSAVSRPTNATHEELRSIPRAQSIGHIRAGEGRIIETAIFGIQLRSMPSSPVQASLDHWDRVIFYVDRP